MTASLAQRMTGFDEHIAGLLHDWPTPGLAVGVLHKGDIAYRCYGQRDVDSGAPVDSGTLFSIGSCSKAFTTMALALLIERGVLDWDTPLRRWLPDFELWDRTASDGLTLRDLACHRSGIAQHNLAWYGAYLSRDELYQRLRYLQPNKPFRYTFGYQNLMYMTAGVLIERVTGQTWEAFVAEHIFQPLGMTATTSSIDAVKAGANSAAPHAAHGGRTFTIPHYAIDAVAPAGAIYSNLEEMSVWLRLHLNGGQHNGQRFIDPAHLAELHRPQIIMPPVPEMVWRDYPEIALNTSGLGWAGLIYRGHYVARHMGSIDGFVAQVAFVPGQATGLIVLTNMNGSLLPVILTFDLLDRVLGLEPVDWSGRLQAYAAQGKAATEQAQAAHSASRQPDRPASHPLAEYAGDYAHPAYGTLRVRQDDGRLTATRDMLTFTLTHYHYDTFELALPVAPVPLLATFSLNPRGAIEAVRVPFEPAVDPIVFTRVN